MMGSQMLDLLRQGVWASLTGGWYYDPYHKIFTNTFHLYTWLTLFCLPLVFHLVCVNLILKCFLNLIHYSNTKHLTGTFG